MLYLNNFNSKYYKVAMKKREKLKKTQVINKIWNLGHDNEDENFEWWEWNCLNPVKVIWKRKIAIKVKKLAGDPQSLLSLGCGCSPMINMFKNTPYIVGVDINAKKLEFLKSRTNALLIEADITKPIPLNGTFECVICTEVIEHFGSGQISGAFKNLAKYCEDKLIISFPSVESFYSKWIETIFHGNLHHFSDNLSLKKIDSLCRENKFRLLVSKKFMWDYIFLYEKIK